jgi:hypothetical protein
VIMVVKTKLVKMIQISLNNEAITVKCSASQRLIKYILFKVIIYSFGTYNFMDTNIILAQ